MNPKKTRHETPPSSRLVRKIINRENLLALLLALLLIGLYIATADSSPLWLYQGF